MIIANFCKGDTTKTLYGLWQWDYGQILRIQGLDLPTATEIHFSLQSKGGEAVTRIGTTKDGVTDVVIPDSMLENNSSAADYMLFAFVYLTDETSGQTEYKICVQVKARPKPEAFDTPEDTELFREAIAAVNNSADRAVAAEMAAEGYANKTSEDAEKTAQDRKEVERLVLSVSGIDDDVKLVAEYKQTAQTAARDADTSAKAALTAQTKAETAKEAAETAQKAAETAAKEAAEDKTAVEQAKADVHTMQSRVAQDKTDVEETKAAFILTAQQAVADVNNAGQTQVDRVEDTGDAAVQNINTAGAYQIDAVEAEGDTQVSRVQEAAQEIVADREQIQQNAQDITGIQQELVLKAPAIIQSVSGNPAIVQDSSEAPAQGLTMQGWTEQASTTGANMLSNNPENWEIQKKVSWGAVPGTLINPLEMSLYYATIKFAVKPSTKYSFKNIETKNLWLARIVETDDNNIGWKNHAMYGNVNTQNKETYTFTTTENTTAVYVSVRTLPETGDGESRDITESDIVNNKIAFNEGEPKYEPYTGGQPSPNPDYPQEIVAGGDWDEEEQKYKYEIKVTGKNLFESRNKQIGYMHGNRGEKIQRFGPTDENFANWNCDCYALPGTEITWTVNSLVLIRASIHFTDEADIVLDTYYDSSPGLFAKYTTTVPDGCKKIYVSVLDNYAYSNDNIEIQVEYGLESTVYEPFNLQTTMLTSNRPLTKWDKLEKRDGVWGWVYKSFEIVLDGNDDEKWGVYAIYSGFSVQRLPQVMLRREGFSETIKIETAAGAPKDYAIVVGYNNIGLYVVNSPIFDSEKDDSGLDEYKAWLRNNPIRLITYLDEETFTPLQDSEQAALNALHSNYPTTILSNNQNCEMSLTYVADTTNYINKAIQEAIQASIANNLLSANSTQALSAKMGAELNSRIEALEE